MLVMLLSVFFTPIIEIFFPFHRISTYKRSSAFSIICKDFCKQPHTGLQISRLLFCYCLQFCIFVGNLCSLNQLCFLYAKATSAQRAAANHSFDKLGHLDRLKELKLSLK